MTTAAYSSVAEKRKTPARRLRVAQVATKFAAGAGRITLLGALALDPEKYETTIFAGEGGTLVDRAEEGGLPVVTLHHMAPHRRIVPFAMLRPQDYSTILTVQPGITGLSQLAFAKESEILDGADIVDDYVKRLLLQKAALDRLYTQRHSVLMDLRILMWTAVAVLFRRDVAFHRTTTKLTLRRRLKEWRPAVSAGPEEERGRRRLIADQ